MLEELIVLTLLTATSGYWMRAQPGPDCWYKDVCDNANSANVISTSPDVPTAVKCYEMCQANAALSGNKDPCKHFRWSEAYYQGRVSGTCALLRSETCVKGDCSSSSCISGPANCADIKEPCGQLLPANAGPGKVTWDCGATFNPYNSPVLDGGICTASCPAWVDSDGAAVMVSYKCVGGTEVGVAGDWAPPFYNGNELTTTSPIVGSFVINNPGQATNCAAECADYPLWYDPNAERGARFFCEPPVDFSTAATTEVNLPQQGACFLFCDHVLVADIFCNNHQWTDVAQDPKVGTIEQ